MTSEVSITWLFVPGSRDNRFDREIGSSADEVILDLEDALPPDTTDAARDQVASWVDGQGAGWVRIKGVSTPWHRSDLAAPGVRMGLRGVMVPKTEDPDPLCAVRCA